MKIEEIIKELNDQKLVQDDCPDEYLYYIEQEILKHYFKDVQIVDEELGVYKSRWFETSITIFACDDYFVRVRIVSNIYSESSSWSDIDWEVEFTEMEKIQVISYKVKEQK